jgi:hypothetical protein
MKEVEFFKKFDMQVHPSHRKLRRFDRLSQRMNAWNIAVSDDAFYQQLNQHTTMQIEEVDCVEILMPKDRLGHIIDYINECEDQIEKFRTDRQLMHRYEQDRSVRLRNPAVEKAYQKYVMLLELARK